MKSRTASTRRRRQILMLGGLLACGGALSLRRALADEMDQMDHSSHMDHASNTADVDMSHMEHEHHHDHAAVPPGVRRTEMMYKIPQLTLVRADGTRVAIPKELDDGRPIILDFIYTSCTEICPVTSQIFSELQQKLGADRTKLRMVSISIDPEYDTPSRLTEYAKKYNAGSQWQYYTGTQEASIAMQRAFDVYRGDKMNHFPATFMRAAPGRPWVRLEGFATPDVLLQEYYGLTRG